jgi:hypothetical protein
VVYEEAAVARHWTVSRSARDIANLTTSRDAGIRYFYVSVDAVKHCFVHNNCLNQSGRVVVLTPGGIAHTTKLCAANLYSSYDPKKPRSLCQRMLGLCEWRQNDLFDFLHAERGSSI